MIAAYTRVSSRSQDLATQRSALTRAADARGDVIAAWFEEKRSGAATARPELARMLDAARAGAVRRLYVFRVDRLTRRGIRDTLGLVEELRGAGVEVISVADGFSLDGPAGDVVLAVMAWAAQMERLALGERISAARERVESKGGRWGRPRAIDPGTLEKAEKLKSEGVSIRKISEALKVPRSTLRGALEKRGHYAR